MTTKVQKKTNNANIYALEMLEQEHIKKTIIDIFKDHIIFFRIEISFFNMFNVFSPKRKKGTDWEADQQYAGYSSVFNLLNIVNEDILCSALGDLTYDTLFENNEDASILSNTLLVLWTNTIKKHFSSKIPF